MSSGAFELQALSVIDGLSQEAKELADSGEFQFVMPLRVEHSASTEFGLVERIVGRLGIREKIVDLISGYIGSIDKTAILTTLLDLLEDQLPKLADLIFGTDRTPDGRRPAAAQYFIDVVTWFINWALDQAKAPKTAEA